MTPSQTATAIRLEAEHLLKQAEKRPTPEGFEVAALRFLKAAGAFRKAADEFAKLENHEREEECADDSELSKRSAASALDMSANQDAARSFRAAEKRKAKTVGLDA